MINFKDITQAVETILTENLVGYVIERNAARNDDPDIAARDKGWIGIYRGSLDLSWHSTGKKYLAELEVKVEIQAASMASGADAEDRLQDAEKEVLDLFHDNLTLGGTVHMINGFNLEYEYNDENDIYFHAVIITIKAQVTT